MKAFLVLLFLGVSYGAPSESDEYFDTHDSWKTSGFGDDSSSFESFEVALASGDDWRKAALDQMNMQRARAKLPPYELDDGLNKMSQSWAEENACTGLKHDEIDMDYFFAESIAGLNTKISGDDKSKLAISGVDSWYSEVKVYDCRKMPQGATDWNYYGNVGHFMNSMNKKFNVVGFGLAMCPGRTTGQLVARFNGKDGFTMKYQDEEMKRQGITYDTFQQLDSSKYVPCPKNFKAY